MFSSVKNIFNILLQFFVQNTISFSSWDWGCEEAGGVYNRAWEAWGHKLIAVLLVPPDVVVDVVLLVHTFLPLSKIKHLLKEKKKKKKGKY